jgi:8-oxo-dGTP pyrophosphatase MutT (NUDIX family)
MLLDQVPALAGILAGRARRTLRPDGKTVAAVLVPLLAVGDAMHLLYTRRAPGLPTHQGQVAFPGGTHDARRDESLLATALREAEEEIGLRAADARVIGLLDDIETMTSRFVITPIVGLVPHPYRWAPNPREVDLVFTVPLADLRAPDAERRETWNFEGRDVAIDVFPVAGQVIWGATHRITRNLLDIVGGLR